MAGASPKRYRVGIMTVDVTEADPEAFKALTQEAIRKFEQELEDEAELSVETFAFEGPHIEPEGGAYAPLDFIQIGISERAERGFSFLIIMTEVDLSSSKMTYTLALPSQLTNVAIVSTRRLDPGFWGLAPSRSKAAERLCTLMLHSLGVLLNLPPSDQPANLMSPISGIETLDNKERFTEAQRQAMRAALPNESLDKATSGNRTAFALSTIATRFPAILRAVGKANPFALVAKLPTMFGTALSVIVVLIFAAETWDYAGEVDPWKISIFALVAFLSAVYVLYRAFAFDAIVSRDGKLMESTVVTTAATALSLLCAVILMFLLLGGLMWLAAETIFPDTLKKTWSTVEPVTTLGDHLKLATFLAAIGVLAGSLGGAADSRNIVRSVLFARDET